MPSVEELLNLAEQLESKHRFTHTLGVMDEAASLAEYYHFDVEKAKIAAILHDITKSNSLAEQKELVIKNFGEDLAKEYSEGCYHGFTAYLYAKDKLGITDTEILDAVFHHTLGRPNMGLLEKIIFLADFYEPSREGKKGKEVKELAYKDINQALVSAMEFTIRKHEEVNDFVPKMAHEALNFYKGQLMTNKEKIIKALEKAALISITMYDLAESSPLFDYVFIATAKNKKHLSAALKYFDEEKVVYDHVEGYNSSEWMLIDAKDIIIHIMTEEAREQYGLDNVLVCFEKTIIE